MVRIPKEEFVRRFMRDRGMTEPAGNAKRSLSEFYELRGYMNQQSVQFERDNAKRWRRLGGGL